MKLSKIIKAFKIEIAMGLVLCVLLAALSVVNGQLDQHIAEYDQAVNGCDSGGRLLK